MRWGNTSTSGTSTPNAANGRSTSNASARGRSSATWDNTDRRRPPEALNDDGQRVRTLAVHCAVFRAGPPPSLPVPPRSLLRPELLVFLVVEFVVQVVVFVEVCQLLLVKLVLLQLVVEVLVQVLVLFEVFELFVVETVAATLERPVRRLTGQHRHPQLRLRLMV